MKKIQEDTDRDFFLSAEESVKYGLIDQKIEKHEMPDQKKKNKGR